MKRALLVAIGVALMACPSVPALAFDGVESFHLPVVEGGGGERFFTGSKRDGHTCGVCHVSEYPDAEVEVSGLPRAGYLEGHVYELDVYWPVEGGVGSAAMLEMTSHWTGEPVGRMELPSTVNLTESELCRGRPALEADEAEGRSLLSLSLCPTDRMHFFWTAPSSTTGPVWLDVAMVTVDGDGTHGGDVVGSASRFVAPANAPVESASVQQGCSTVGAMPRGGFAVFALLACLLWRRRFVCCQP